MLDARFKVLTLPITVYATEDYPHAVPRPDARRRARWRPDLLDLNAVTRGPEGETPRPGPLRVRDHDTAARRRDRDDQRDRPHAPGQHERATGDGRQGWHPDLVRRARVLDEAVNVRVTQSDRQAPRVQDFAVDALPGVASNVNVLDGAFNPFAPEPLRVVSADVVAGRGPSPSRGGSLARPRNLYS